MSRPFLVLDRDGTIIVEKNYLSDPAEVELLPGAAQGLSRIQAMGYGLVIVTNQSGIGRGYFTRECLQDIHDRLLSLLAEHHVRIDGIYVCPHTPEENCSCRKPKPALLWQAAQELAFSPTACMVVGDKPCDIELGRAVGAKTVLVRTGYGATHEAQGLVADWIVDNLDTLAESLSETALTVGCHRQNGMS